MQPIWLNVYLDNKSPKSYTKKKKLQNFGVTNKEYYGMLWYFLQWSITCNLNQSRNIIEPTGAQSAAQPFLVSSRNALRDDSKNGSVQQTNGRFPFNKNLQLEFSATSRSKWDTALSKISKKEDNVRWYTQILKIFVPKIFFPCHFATGISRTLG